MLDILKRHLYSKKNRRDVSVLVYNFKCNRCNAKYIGKTKQHYRTQTSERISVSPIIGKCVKNNSKDVIIYVYVIICMLFCNTILSPENLWILAKSSCNSKLGIQQSILIQLSKPTLNNNISVPLYLFW